jgi:hypothetical protein
MDSRSRKIKFAVVPSKLTMENLLFLETTSKNRGLIVKVCDSVQGAVQRLKDID